MAVFYNNSGTKALDIKGVLHLEPGQVTPPIEITGFMPDASSLEAAKALGLMVMAETDLVPPPAPSPDGTVLTMLGVVVGEGSAVDAGEIIEVTGPAETLSVSGHSFVRHPATHEAQTRFLYSPEILPVGGRFKAMAGPIQTHTAGATTYEIRPFQVL